MGYWILGVILSLALFGPTWALDLNEQRQFDIPAQKLGTALVEFSRQAKAPIVSSTRDVERFDSPGVSGRMSLKDALKTLLQGTGLDIRTTESGAIAVGSFGARIRVTDGAPATLLAEAPVGQTLGSSPPAAKAAESSAPPAIQEIVVTSQKREESLQNVPISVAAYTREALEQFHVEAIEDIIRLTPGVAATYSAGGFTPIVSIRGISSNIGQSTTGIYIDDTPIQVRYIGAGATTAQGFPAVFDLDRIEVLRGPQGTLFGAGSEGGTIRFITPEPSFVDYTGRARAEFGWNEVGAPSYQFGAALGGPLKTDTLGFRLSAYVQQDGGWIDQKPYPEPFVSVRNVNAQTTLALSGALAWVAADGLTITPKVFYQSQNAGGPSVYTRDDSDPGSGIFVNNAVVPQPIEDRIVLPSLKIDWLLRGVDLLSNTSYMDRISDITKDYTLSDNVAFTGNYTGPIAPAPGYNQNPQRQFTQELRLQSTGEGRLIWTVGGFYQVLSEHAVEPVASTNFGNWTQEVFGKTVQQLLGENLLPGDLIYVGQDYSRDTQFAGFGQLAVKILESVTLTGGVRYGVDKFEYSNAQDGPFNGGPTGSGGSARQSVVTPKIGIDYEPLKGLMFYATGTKGYRPGGPNTPVPSSCDSDLRKLGYSSEPATYQPDYVWSYEVGSKGEGLDRHLSWDASAYYVKWSQPQTQFLLPVCGGYTFVANAGAAASKGFDLQTRLSVSDNLTLGGSFGYDNARYTETVAAANAQNVVTSGQLLPTPPWQGMISADYWLALAHPSNARAYLHIDDTYASGYNPSDRADALYDPLNPNVRQATNLTGIRLGLRTSAWDASLFVSNAFNSHPTINTIHLGGASSNYYNVFTVPPRVIGVTGTYKF